MQEVAGDVECPHTIRAPALRLVVKNLAHYSQNVAAPLFRRKVLFDAVGVEK
jgi:hypothetical protein